MKVEFRASKNNSLTCSKDGFSLHSNYNPEAEANKFVNNIKTDFIPTNIIITGPCLPYLCDPLKSRFKNANIIAIQYTKDFSDYNSAWDKVFIVDSKKTALDFQEELFSHFGEEQLFSSLFLSWKPSENPFQDEYSIAWEGIKLALDKSKSIIGTISFFNKTWLFNSLRFFKYSKNIFSLKKINHDIIITASGPSLLNQIEFIKTHKNNFFVMALSSSVCVLLKNEIIPDAILSTDGGYYAKRHLKILETKKEYQNIPIIFPPEGKLSTNLLSKNPIIPLLYTDTFEKELLSKLEIEFQFGSRNGTVSGTAVELALQLTNKNIYFAGLDLASSKGFSHTQPNALEEDDCLSDYKLKSTENRIVPSTFKNQSLEIYRNWFATRNEIFYKRVFRLVSEKDDLKQIKNLKDIKNKEIHLENSITNNFFINQNKSIDKKQVIKYFENKKNEITKETKINSWFKIASYTDCIQYMRCEEEKKELLFAKLKENTISLLNEVLDYLKK